MAMTEKEAEQLNRAILGIVLLIIILIVIAVGAVRTMRERTAQSEPLPVPPVSEDPLGAVIHLHSPDSEEEFGKLFSVSTDFQPDLDTRTFSQDLQQELEKHQIFLPRESRIFIRERGKKWTILNKHGYERYILKKENEELVVYLGWGYMAYYFPEDKETTGAQGWSYYRRDITEAERKEFIPPLLGQISGRENPSDEGRLEWVKRSWWLGWVGMIGVIGLVIGVKAYRWATYS